jgi:hypothetical protein
MMDDVGHHAGPGRDPLGKLIMTNLRLIYVAVNILWQMFDGRFATAFAEITELGMVDDRLRGRPFVGDMWLPCYIGVGSTNHWFVVRGSYGPKAKRARQEVWLSELAEKTTLEPNYKVER